MKRLAAALATFAILAITSAPAFADTPIGNTGMCVCPSGHPCCLGVGGCSVGSHDSRGALPFLAIGAGAAALAFARSRKNRAH
jgi:hypothetical protein